MKAFLTGSHAYGTPNSKSDIDLVVYAERKAIRKLKLLVGMHEKTDVSGEDADLGASLKFGNLNLILVADMNRFRIWKDGTDELISKKPVTREEAVTLFRNLRDSMA